MRNQQSILTWLDLKEGCPLRLEQLKTEEWGGITEHQLALTPLAPCAWIHDRHHLRLVSMNLRALVHCSSQLNWVLQSEPWLELVCHHHETESFSHRCKVQHKCGGTHAFGMFFFTHLCTINPALSMSKSSPKGDDSELLDNKICSCKSSLYRL